MTEDKRALFEAAYKAWEQLSPKLFNYYSERERLWDIYVEARDAYLGYGSAQWKEFSHLKPNKFFVN